MPAPVKHTCRSIDIVLSSIKRAFQVCEIEYYNSPDGDTKESFWEIRQELYGLDSSLEELRSNNLMLRTWGEELEDLLGESQLQVEELEEKVFNLERRLEKYELLEKDPNQLKIDGLW